MSAKSTSLKCEGAIFHFDSNCVLFEFADDNGDDAIGVIKSTNIRLQDGLKITKEACSNLSEYLQLGDMLKCTVFRKDGLDKVLCGEDEQDLDVNGQVRMSNNTIEIQPKWIAHIAGTN